MTINTKCIHGSTKKYDTTGAVSVPIFQSAVFSYPGVGETTGFDYSRQQNPTREYIEDIIANLENGIGGLAFASGMAAITLTMELFSPGDHIILSDNLYGGSYRLFYQIYTKNNGLSFTLVDAGDISAIEKQITPKTKAIFIETPSNPVMHVTDIAAVSALAKAHDLLVIADNTFLTPYFQKPLDLGVDIVVHSGTKFLGGHNDTLSGFLAWSNPALSDKLRFLHKCTGACLSPFDSWLMIRSIKTLSVRMDRHEENTRRIAEWLSNQPRIRKVYYPGLKTHPQYEISCRQATGFGGVLSFEAESAEAALKILGGVRIIQFGESLGGAESLLTYPVLQTHADIPKEEREAKGITDKLIRLSVGLEDYTDLTNDLDRAINS